MIYFIILVFSLFVFFFFFFGGLFFFLSFCQIGAGAVLFFTCRAFPPSSAGARLRGFFPPLLSFFFPHRSSIGSGSVGCASFVYFLLLGFFFCFHRASLCCVEEGELDDSPSVPSSVYPFFLLGTLRAGVRLSFFPPPPGIGEKGRQTFFSIMLMKSHKTLPLSFLLVSSRPLPFFLSGFRSEWPIMDIPPSPAVNDVRDRAPSPEGK